MNETLKTMSYESPIGIFQCIATDSAIVSIRPLAAGEKRSKERATGALAQLEKELNAYFKGELKRFSVKLAPSGTKFQKAVWRELLRIPKGATRTYGEIARDLDRPTASRAVGAANGRNPIAILVPCHRVIGKNGSLTGYAWGLDKKAWLLAHEAA